MTDISHGDIPLDDDRIVHKTFPNLAMVRAAASEVSTVSETPEVSTVTVNNLEEGDFITGFVDITNERAYMVPPVENWDHAYGKNREVRACLHLVGWLTKRIRQEKILLSLQIIPQEYRDEWTLHHLSNAIWRMITTSHLQRLSNRAFIHSVPHATLPAQSLFDNPYRSLPE